MKNAQPNPGTTAPDYVVRSVKNIRGNPKWVDIGVAYVNTRGSVTVYLTALPLNDKLFLIPAR
jgi:hypothetical protein